MKNLEHLNVLQLFKIILKVYTLSLVYMALGSIGAHSSCTLDSQRNLEESTDRMQSHLLCQPSKNGEDANSRHTGVRTLQAGGDQ